MAIIPSTGVIIYIYTKNIITGKTRRILPSTGLQLSVLCIPNCCPPISSRQWRCHWGGPSIVWVAQDEKDMPNKYIYIYILIYIYIYTYTHIYIWGIWFIYIYIITHVYIYIYIQCVCSIQYWYYVYGTNLSLSLFLMNMMHLVIWCIIYIWMFSQIHRRFLIVVNVHVYKVHAYTRMLKSCLNYLFCSPAYGFYVPALLRPIGNTTFSRYNDTFWTQKYCMWCCGAIGGRAAGMALCDFLNPAVPLGKRVRHDLGVTFGGACTFQILYQTTNDVYHCTIYVQAAY